MSVRLYGRVIGHASHVTVTQGFQGVLERAGLLEGVVPLDNYNDQADMPGGILAHHAVFSGPLNLLRHLRQNARHERHWVVVAPNSSHIPPILVKEMRDYGVTALAPSKWAASQIEPYDLPVVVVPHGVTAEPVANREEARRDYARGIFRVVHFSTSAGERKGTFELIKGWMRLREMQNFPRASSLFCVLDYEAIQALTDKLVDHDVTLDTSVHIRPRFDMSAGLLSQWLGKAHVVCQPSRGEAFGLLPLESLSVGVPVCATLCAGHSEYLQVGTPGLIPIKSGENAPIDDGPGAQAPAVDAGSIATALYVAWFAWSTYEEQAQRNALAVQEAWSWDRQLAPFVELLRAS